MQKKLALIRLVCVVLVLLVVLVPTVALACGNDGPGPGPENKDGSGPYYQNHQVGQQGPYFKEGPQYWGCPGLRCNQIVP